jgi:hypothetical protein
LCHGHRSANHENRKDVEEVSLTHNDKQDNQSEMDNELGQTKAS